MTPPNTPEKDPIQDLLENKHINVDDVKEDNVRQTQEDLNREKATAETQQETKEELSIFSLITRTEILIDKYKRIEKEARKLNKHKESDWVEWIQEWQARVQIDELENILNILKRYQKKWDNLSQDSLNRYDQELKNKEENFKKFEEQRDRIVLNATTWWTAYEIKVNTLKDALKLERNIDKINKSLQKITEVLRRATLKSEVRLELEWLQTYLESAINNPSTPLAPFELQHREDIKKLNVIDPDLYYLIQKNVNPSPQVSTQNPSANPWGGTTTTGNNPSNAPYCPTGIAVPTYQNTDWKETFQQGGVKWILRKAMNYTNMSDWQKDTWTNGIFLVWIWVAIWQAGKRLFKTKEKWWMSFWAKAAIIWWWLFAANALTWKNLFELVQKWSTWWLELDRLKTNKPKTDAETQQEMQNHVNDPAMASTVLWDKKIADLDNVLDKDFKLKEYDKVLNEYRNSSKAEERALWKELESLWKNDPNWRMKNWLATMWITPENYKNLDQNKTVLDYFKIYVANTNTFDAYLKNKKLVLVNWKEAERDNLIRSGKTITNDDIKKLEDTWILIPQAVEWPVDNEKFDFTKDDKLNLTTQVASFNMDQNTKNKLIKYWNILNKEIPWWSKKTPEFKESGWEIYLKNYWEWTKINVNEKSLIWLNNEQNNTIKFDQTMEMMKVANLTNYIKSLFRGRKTWTKAEDYHPFKESSVTDIIDWKLNWFGDLVYVTEDKDPKLPRYNPKKYGRSDTEVIGSNWFWDWDLNKVSPVLNSNVDNYAKYLNQMDIWHQWKKTDGLPS